MIHSAAQQCIDEIISSRRATRAFLPTPVGQDELREILRVASHAPSGSNAQPWKVYVLTGASLQRLSRRVLAVHNDDDELKKHREEYHYYPVNWVSPYLERRRKIGWDLYALLQLGRDDKAGMRAQHGRNFAFFDAPVGFIFTIDRVMEQGSWLDYGTFLQNIMLAARARGLDTCPLASFTQFHQVVREVLEFPESEMLVCGMALGYADTERIENTLVTERAEVDRFAKFFE